MYTPLENDEPNPFLNVEYTKTPFAQDFVKIETKEEPSKIKNPSSSLSDDDWGTLDFTPMFIGKYKVSNLSFMKKQDEPKNKIFSPLMGELKNTFVHTYNEEIVETIKPKCYDIQTYEAPLSSENIADCYCIGYTLLKKLRFNRKGCKNFEQGIWVPMDSGFHEHAYGLGFKHY